MTHPHNEPGLSELIKKILIFLVLVVHPGFAAVMEVSGWDEVRDRGVASLVSAEISRSDLRYGSQPGIGFVYRGQCYIEIRYTQTKPSKSKSFRQVTHKDDTTCWGVPKVPTSYDVILTIFNHPKSGIPITSESGGVDNFTPDRCYVIQGFATKDASNDNSYAQFASTQPGVCRMAPSASRCEINIPSHIQHRPAFVGVVHSTEAINAEISCNRPTNVRVSVPNNVVLSQGYSEITSAISLGDAGSSDIIVSPNPTTSFKISSTIAANTPTPGTYTGSFVLVAEWD